jgi:CarD family transcriptional regulator
MAKSAVKKVVKNQKVQVKTVKLVSVKKIDKSKPANAKNATKSAVKVVATSAKPVVKAAAPKLSIVAKQAQKPKSEYEYEVGQCLVYPTHGVGKVTNIETTEVAGTKMTLYVLYFEKEKMTLRVPVSRALAVGLRKLSSNDQLNKAVSVLKSKPKTARGMWSRRATEYNSKINSGNIEEIAEVVRDLHKNVEDPDRSYSERIIYEQAFDRFAGEFAAINKLNVAEANERLVKTLGKKAA